MTEKIKLFSSGVCGWLLEPVDNSPKGPLEATSTAILSLALVASCH